MGIEGIALAKFGAGALVLAMTIVAIARISTITFRDFGARLWRPTLAAALMAGVLVLIPAFSDSHLVLLGAKVATGAGVYLIALAALWRLAGAPDGPERVALRFGAAVFARLRGRA